MIQVEFIFNSISTIIQSNKNEKVEEIFKKFVEKIGIDINSIIFSYNQNIINKELTLDQISNDNDKLKNHIKILVKNITKSEQSISNINLKEVICPKCGELSNIIIKDYKFDFYECKMNIK